MPKMPPTVEMHAPPEARYAVVLWCRGEPLVYEWCATEAEARAAQERRGDGFVVQERP